MSITRPLIYAHIGDLHIEVEWDTNYRDLQAIVAALKPFGPQIDFIHLPGDIANNGKNSEFERVTEALRPLGTKRVHAISGDHEMVQGSLDNFYAHLRLPGNVAPKELPYAEPIAPGVTGIFLDMCGRGTGQADFRLDPDPKARPKRKFTVKHQVAWLRDWVAETKRCVVFMHTYPADLVDPLEQAAVVKILSAPNVLLVDIGHTHYNEISNDGQKLYAATRSTGQIEEGEVGYAITTIDENIVSWRFRLLAAQGPIVLITSPVDRRLATIHSEAAMGTCELRVTVLSTVGRVTSCTYSVDGLRPPKPMTRMPQAERGRHRFADTVRLPAGARFITVRATDSTGDGEETIQLTREADKAIYRHADGSDADRLGRWSERGLLATQLGPNRNGKKW